MNHQNIYVIDPEGSTGQTCGCGNIAMFLMGISGISIHVCEDCISELAKRIIDGLR